MKLNNKGFAITGIIYAILLLFIVLIVGILMMLGNRKILLDKLKNEIIDKIEGNEVYKDNSGANQPLLLTNMTPIKHNGSNWVVADIHEEWYDYDEKKWANAVVLNSGVSKNVGDIINIESDVALMYVWIPRYKYTIWNGNNGVSDVQEINISFETGYNSNGTVECVDEIKTSGTTSETCWGITNNESTYTHPAFTFDGKELTGFWVGKFELSTTDETCLTTPSIANCNTPHTLETKPNKSSLKFIDVKNMFESNLNIRSFYNISDGDSHMIKNMEWGAVTYLMNSKYGRCESGTCTDAIETTTDSYETTLGQASSSTGNVYGVYDLNGNSLEMVMANMVDSSGIFYVSGSSSFNPDQKYYDIYTYSDSNIDYNRGKLGDGTKEIIKSVDGTSWYDKKSVFSYSSYPWIIRGGSLTESTFGSFTFGSFNGGADDVSSRTILVRR